MSSHPHPPFCRGCEDLLPTRENATSCPRGGLPRFLGAPQTCEGPTPRESAVVCATESLGDGHGWLCQAASPSRRDRGRTSCGCERGRPTPAASGKRPGKRHVGVTGPSSRSPSSSRTPAADATGQSGRGADAAKSMRPSWPAANPVSPSSRAHGRLQDERVQQPGTRVR